MAKDKWMQKAFSKNKGKLHRKLKVPEDEKIPQSKLESAYATAKQKGDTETMREINAAKTAGKISRARKKYGKAVVRGVQRK